MSDLSNSIYQLFSTEPLRADQQELYVDLHEVRGDADVVKRLARRIELSDTSTCQVLAGHRGSGKSTELLRLQKRLQESTSKRPFVVVCSTDDDLDRNDVDFPQVLISIVRQTAAALKKVGINLQPGYFADRVKRLGGLLTTPIEFTGLDLDLGLASLSATMKSSPDAREAINKLLEPDTGNWINAANDVFSEAVPKLKELGRSGLVILVDDLDKMVVRPHAAANCMTDEHLFVHRAAQLRAFNCHVVYTMPISLAYSHVAGSIRSSFSGDLPIVPMTKVRHRPPSAEPYQAGVEKFKELIERRCKAAGVSTLDVFADEAAVHQIIQLSGGQPSELMSLVRESIVTKPLPIDADALGRARVNGRRDFTRSLRAEHWALITQVKETGTYTRTAETEPLFRQLLEGRVVLQYVNDDEWYGVNPMLDDAKAP